MSCNHRNHSAARRAPRWGIMAVGFGIAAVLAAGAGTASAESAPPAEPNDIATMINGLAFFHDSAAAAASSAGLYGLSMADGPGSSVDDLLGTATTNFTAATDVLGGIDVTGPIDISGIVSRQIHIDDLVLQAFADKLVPAESAILAGAGPWSGLFEQFLIDPVNQNWTNASDAMLSGAQALEAAAANGSNLDILSAGLQLVGVDFFQIIPAAFASIPVEMLSNFF